MAERRMFAKTIIKSDAFLDMPATAKVLYFYLMAEADDDGFVNSPKSVIRNAMCTEDDMKVLMAKRFVILFESGVIVIKHWRMHNYIRSDRYKPTVYGEEMSKLTVKDNGAYSLGNQLDTDGIPTVYQMDTQVSIGKVSIGEDSKKRKAFEPPTLQEVSDYISSMNYNVNAEAFVSFYESKGWVVGKSKMKDWKAAVRGWHQREAQKKGGWAF